MRYWLFLLLFLTVAVYAQEEDYRSGNYQAAIAAYEQRVSDGEANGGLFYNLGSAYYEAGHLGQALLNYRRAEIYLPRNGDVQLQIARLRGEREDIIGAEVDWLLITTNLSADILTIYELSILVFGFWALYFLLLALSRRALRWLLWLTAAGMLIGIFFLGIRLYVENQQPEAIVLVDAAQIMTGPGDDYLPLYILYEGAELRILEQREDWYRFALADGRVGWILTEHVGMIVIP